MLSCSVNKFPTVDYKKVDLSRKLLGPDIKAFYGSGQVPDQITVRDIDHKLNYSKMYIYNQIQHKHFMNFSILYPPYPVIIFMLIHFSSTMFTDFTF